MLLLFAALLFLLGVVALFAHAPSWVCGGLLFASLLPSAALARLSGLEEAAAPLLLQVLALGGLLPKVRRSRASHPVSPAARTSARAAHEPLRSSAARRRSGLLPVRVLPPRFSRGRGRGRVFAPRDTSSPFDLSDIPGFEVLEKVGSGGMASVFRARRRRSGEVVALKVPAEAFWSDEAFLRRFHREAELAQRLSHPNVVRTFEHGSVGAKHYLTMEFIDGPSLESYLDAPEHLTDYALSRELMRQAVRALRHIHRAGIVHRDIKPANFMLRREGMRGGDAPLAPDALKLMDFGVAAAETLAELAAGARVGTPSYMSPEQARGLCSDEKSDIYSLGLVFYELLTGRAAFRGSYEGVVHQQIFGTPSPPRQHAPSVPCDLEALVMQMIAKDPAARPSLTKLESWLRHASLAPPKRRAPPRSRLLCVVHEPRAALQVLDLDGRLHTAVGAVGARALPGAPRACACDPAGNFYLAVLEEGPQADYPMIHKLSPEGEPLGAFGRYGLAPGEFLRPVALAAAPDGTLLVLDAETHLVQRFRACGELIACFGGQGAGEGRFSDPRDLLVAPSGDLFVLDHGNASVQHFGPCGRYLNRWAYTSPARVALPAEGAAQAQGARQPLSGFAVDRVGGLYLVAAGGGTVQRIDLGSGAVSTLTLEAPPPAAPPVGGEGDPHPVDLGADLSVNFGAGFGVDPSVDLGLDLSLDDQRHLFVAARGGRVIYKYAPSGALLATLETYAPILQLRMDVRR